MSRDDDRKAILARRKRFVTLALAGTTVATTATACVCLSPIPPPDSGLDSRPDAGRDAGRVDAARFDADVRDGAPVADADLDADEASAPDAAPDLDAELDADSDLDAGDAP